MTRRGQAGRAHCASWTVVLARRLEHPCSSVARALKCARRWATFAANICLVTPFAWSQPHDVNEHVAGIAAPLRELGHDVTVLAPSARSADLRAGRHALLEQRSPAVIAVGPAVPISRRSQMGVPVGVRANLSLALAQGRFDVVHGFEPGLPSLSYLGPARGRRDRGGDVLARTERLSYPPARSQREKLLTRLDALIALSEPVRDAAAERFPGDYRLLSPGVDL